MAPDANVLQVAAETFYTSITSRLTGVIIGNVLAGVFLKSVTDFIRFKLDESKRNKDLEERRKRFLNKGGEDEQRESNSMTNVLPNGIPADAWLKLVACIVIDFLGDASFALPGLGELEDVAWAPVSAYALRFLFGSNAVAGLDFAKEILPGTDFVPVATLAWALTYLFPNNPLGKALGLPDLTDSSSSASNPSSTNRK